MRAHACNGQVLRELEIVSSIQRRLTFFILCTYFGNGSVNKFTDITPAASTLAIIFAQSEQSLSYKATEQDNN